MLVLTLLALIPVQASPPPATRAVLPVELRLVRISRGEGPALVSNGVPLPPAALRSADVERLRVTVDGQERPAHIAALHGTHPDGSLRAVLVQFRADLPAGRPARAMLELAAGAAARRLPRQPTDPDSIRAVALPFSASYLVSTGIVGQTIPVSASRTLGAAFHAYETKAAAFSNDHWRREGSSWSAGNYYDRVLGHYALWARTASPTYWQRATAIALDYRTRYLEAHRYGASPHWAQLEGLAAHYWVTGDERSRTAVIETARILTSSFPVEKSADPAYRYNEGRIQQRVMLAALLAWQLGDTSREWGAMADGYVANWLRQQRPDGSFRYRLNTEDAKSPMGQSNFMEGLRMSALAKYYDARRKDPRIVDAVRRQVDYLWTTQWVEPAGGFRYWNIVRNDVAVDLNMLHVVGFGFVYRETGLARYRQWGDRVFAAAVSGTFYSGTKQYNQQQYDSFLYLGLRSAVARSNPSRATSPMRPQS